MKKNLTREQKLALIKEVNTLLDRVDLWVDNIILAARTKLSQQRREINKPEVE
jgi:hypothetical protein